VGRRQQRAAVACNQRLLAIGETHLRRLLWIAGHLDAPHGLFGVLLASAGGQLAGR
jgi:hypothetical protein